MYTVLLVIHTLLVLFLIGLILIQRSGDDGLSGLGGGGSNLLSGRAAGNVLTRATAILATLFILTSLVLGVMVSRQHGGSLFDAAPVAEETPTPQNTQKEPSVPKPE